MRGVPTTPPHSAGSDACLAVGIDLGTTNTKVALVAIGPAGVQVRAVASAPTPKPETVKSVLTGLLRRILDKSPPPVAVGIASMAETGVPLDRSGQPLGRWLRWDSHRAEQEATALSQSLGWAQLVRTTGVRPGAKVPLATWAWLRSHRPEQWSAMSAWAGAADFVCLLATGRLATDHTLAGRTMAYRLPSAGAPPPESFDADLLAEVGLRPRQLPTVVPPGQLAGHVRDAAFVACGLREGTPVVIAGHDHAVGAYACGAREPGDVADSLGTAEAVMSIVAGQPDPVEVATAGMSTVVTVGGQHRAIIAGSSSAGATVGWWLEHEAAGWAAEDLFRQVLELDDRPGDVIVLPYLSGRQTPCPDPTARLQVLGRRPEHTTVELARSMLEGLCLQARWMLQEQARLAAWSGATPSVTLLGGAVTANPAWVRIKAHVMPWPVHLVTTAEPVAAGAALLAAVRSDHARAPAPTLDRRAGPTLPGAGTAYDQALARFVAAATDRRPGPQGDDR